MKMLYLTFKTYSKGFAREIFLMLQIFVSVSILNAAILPFVNYFEQEHIIRNCVDNSVAYYSVPYERTEGGMDYVGRFLDGGTAFEVGLSYHTIGVVNGQDADIYLYSKGMFSAVKLLLSSGQWRYDEGTVYLNQALYDKCAGEKISVDPIGIELPSGEALKAGGVINKKELVFDCGVAGGEPGIEALSRCFSDAGTNGSRERFVAIIPFDLATNAELRTKLTGAVLRFDSPEAARAYAAQYAASGESGKISLMSELYSNAQKKIVKTYNLQIVIGTLMTISTLFGIGGYTYLNIQSARGQMGIYSLCGCTKRAYYLIILFSQLPVIFIPAAMAFALRNVLIMSEGTNTGLSLLIASGFVFLVFLAPVAVAAHSSRKIPFYSLIQEEE